MSCGGGSPPLYENPSLENVFLGTHRGTESALCCVLSVGVDCRKQRIACFLSGLCSTLLLGRTQTMILVNTPNQKIYFWISYLWWISIGEYLKIIHVYSNSLLFCSLFTLKNKFTIQWTLSHWWTVSKLCFKETVHPKPLSAAKPPPTFHPHRSE